ncbi:hypothetical protein EDB87DRAFT_475361 [Lactarius vividus]|nr:hypothetical protein EDB87DRAFT_475361 [Lactarius vividus]
MSRDPHQSINTIGIGDDPYPPQLTSTQAPHEAPNFVDGSGPIFSMYLEMATEEDKKMAENWKADADGILIFTGFFSAAVASLISVTIQDIRPNPQDTSNFYLANIYYCQPESLGHVTVHTSGHESVHSFPKGSRSSSRGRLKRCLHYYTFPCSCSLLAWLCSFSPLSCLFSVWCYHGSAFALLYMDLS